ncbi:MAG: ComEC/Rec2 family competence protein [Oligoflexales bacterium]|nr:ComEC/Rec2 family competence protein [Oligoflexales bacterium]
MSKCIEQLGFFLLAFVLMQMLAVLPISFQFLMVFIISLLCFVFFQLGHLSRKAAYLAICGALYGFINSKRWFSGIEIVTELSIVLYLKETIQSAAQLIPMDLRPWYLGILFGDMSYLSGSIKDAFKSSGLYHLLVLSGSHITVLYLFICGSLTYPLKIFYALKWLSAKRFYFLSRTTLLFSMGVLFIYCAITGFFPPTQRAFIISTLTLIFNLVGLKLPLYQKICIALFFQILFFPSLFFSLSTLISWSVYLLMLAIYSSENFFSEMYFQILVFVFMWVVFSQSNLISLFLNPIAMRIFPFVLISALLDFVLTIVFGVSILSQIIAEIQRTFIGSIINVAEISNNVGYLNVAAFWDIWIITASVGIIFASVLNSIAKVSKRKLASSSSVAFGEG